MKKLINEELDRIKLMMNYNPKNTLTENKILIEQAWKAAVEDLGRIVARDETTVLKSLENAANDGLINIKNMKTEAGVTLTKMSEVLEALKAGTLGPSGTGQVAKGLFLKGSTPEMRIAGAEAITSMGKFTEKFAGKTKEEIVQALEQANVGYTKADAELLADTYLRKGGVKPIKQTTQQAVDDATKEISAKIGSKPTDRIGTWNAIKNHFGKNWKKYLATGVLLTIFYSFFPGEEPPIDDDDVKPNPEPAPTPVSDKCPTYTNCSSPYKKCCKSEVIRKVQGCLNNYYGANLRPDGKFGPLTQSALIDAGFGETFTDEQVNTICKVQTSPEPTPGEDSNLPTPERQFGGDI